MEITGERNVIQPQEIRGPRNNCRSLNFNGCILFVAFASHEMIAGASKKLQVGPPPSVWGKIAGEKIAEMIRNSRKK